MPHPESRGAERTLVPVARVERAPHHLGVAGRPGRQVVVVVVHVHLHAFIRRRVPTLVEGAETASVLNGSLKGVGSVANIHQENIGLPRLLHQFNAKPVLMAAAAPPWGGDRQGVVHVSRNEDYLEFGLDVGADFAATSNHALFRLLPKLPRLVMDIAWIVEGRAPEALPENVLAAMRLHHLDFEAQAWGVEDWLRGPGGFSSGESP